MRRRAASHLGAVTIRYRKSPAMNLFFVDSSVVAPCSASPEERALASFAAQARMVTPSSWLQYRT